MIADLSDISDADLLVELGRRGALGRCATCRRWKAYYGAYDRDGFTLRCSGCIRAVGGCTCR